MSAQDRLSQRDPALWAEACAEADEGDDLPDEARGVLAEAIYGLLESMTPTGRAHQAALARRAALRVVDGGRDDQGQSDSGSPTEGSGDQGP